MPMRSNSTTTTELEGREAASAADGVVESAVRSAGGWPGARSSVMAMDRHPMCQQRRKPRSAKAAAVAGSPESPRPKRRRRCAATLPRPPSGARNSSPDADGSAAIEFTVPDSVTSWNVWVHAVTRDLQSGSLHKEAQSVKELMVRPYLPRFLREGDKAELKVVVNNASERELERPADARYRRSGNRRRTC